MGLFPSLAIRKALDGKLDSWSEGRVWREAARVLADYYEDGRASLEAEGESAEAEYMRLQADAICTLAGTVEDLLDKRGEAEANAR